MGAPRLPTTDLSAMNTRRLHSSLLTLLLGIVLLALPARAALDLFPVDGFSDIWVMKYGVSALSAAGDADGDGLSNGAEAAAGTDPFSATSIINFSSVTLDGGGLHLAFPTLLGKRYRLQSTASLSPSDWQNVADPSLFTGTGADVLVTLSAAGATERFYRVVVQDTDTDGDGVNDWEELTLGFDPNNSRSNGVAGDDDLATITAALQATNLIRITASDATATEPPVAPAFDTGVFTITRSGGLNPVTVNYSVGGGAAAGSDYTALTGTVTLPIGVNTATVTVTPLADAAVESPEAVIVSITDTAAYNLGAPAVATVLIGDNVTPNGDGVLARYWNSSVGTINTYATAFPASAAVVSRIEAQVNNFWATNTSPTGTTAPGNTATATTIAHDYFVSRYTADVLPEFSQIYTFEADVNTAGRLVVNGQVMFDVWGGSSGTYSGTIELAAGTRYPIVFEQMERTGDASAILRWSSANRPEELIPQARLFSNAPPQILSPVSVLLIKDGPAYNYQILASGSPTGYSAANLPPGWTLNTATGLIAGTPTTAGTWDIALTATNGNGSGSTVLNLQIIATGGAIGRDLWTGVSGTAVSAIPLTTAPTSSALITTLETAQSAPDADNFGARIRGYITAPISGVYKFWLTASDNAELYISDDDEPVNSFKRAAVTTATAYREWGSVNAGKSPLLILTAGRRYYVEILHKAGVGPDHLSVGWIKPGEGGADPANAPAPTEVVPGYALSPYVTPVPTGGESTLYATSMTAQGAAVSGGYGAGSLQLSADESQAILRFNYSNLSAPVTSKHVHSDAWNSNPSQIIFDIDDATPEQDGSYVWDIAGAGALSAAQIVQIIKDGASYINIHSANYPAGEIRGNFRFQAASQTFTPPAPLTWSDPASAASPESALNRNAAARFLVQSTFGANATEIASVQALGFSGWIDDQLTKPVAQHYPYVFQNRTQTDPNGNTYPNSLTQNSWWKNSVSASDQLRQRVAFALSEILVVSTSGPLTDRADTVSDYYDMLLANAFGNARTLLEDVTLHPAMGRYLDMLRNDKPDKATGRIPNENYAREIKQLFSIGLNRMHPDGSLMLNSKGELIPTYDQDAIIGFAHAFTGWDYYYTGTYHTTFSAGSNWINPMREVPARHYTGQKRLLNNVILPGMPMFAAVPLDPYANHAGNAALVADPTFQGLAALEMDAAHDALFNHPNFGPFICRQLIQRLVTSTPSRGYVYRVVQKFSNNGSGVRGDMVAIVKAILLDHEARSATLLTQQGYGKQREPISRVTAVGRAFPAPAPVTGSYTQVGNLITVTTGAPHLYASGNTAFLDFSGGVPSDPDDAAYTLSNVTATGFTARALTSQGVTYSQTGGTITITETDTHNYNVGNSVYIDFTTGAPDSPADGFYTVAVDDPFNVFFTVNVPTTKTATYSQTGSTITCTSTAHGFTAGVSVYLDFTTGTPSAQIDGLFTVDTAADANTFTVTAADAVARTGAALATPAADAASRTGAATMSKAAYAVDRTGSLAVTYSDWGMGSTNTDLNQTPLDSPTVFNFFLPDYQYPGLLGQAGLVTPEFELTSETSVIRQSNFLYNGVFNDALGQLGLASFRSGARDVFVDLRPWMGTGPGGLSWVNNANVNQFIDELNTLLMGGQLPASAKTIIRTYALTLPMARGISTLGSSTVTTVTAVNHGFTNGASVTIANVTGGTFSPSINGTHVLTVTGLNTFTIPVNCSNASVTLTSATATSAGNARTITGVNGHTTVTTTASHGLVSGNTVTIAGVTGGTYSPTINGSYPVTVTSSTAFLVPVTRTNNTGLVLTSAGVSVAGDFPDLIRDRVRAIVHLLVTSPDFTIQK